MNCKDWTGNKQSTYATLGARNYAQNERETNDYYATEPKAAQLLMEAETFSPQIWECACGEGHLAKEFERAGYEVLATDLIYRGYGNPKPLDFLKETLDGFGGDIVTNPPYKYALEFVEKALNSVQEGHKVAMFLKLQFLEGKSRKQFFLHNPPKTVYVSSSRLICALNGDFEKITSSAVAYAWFVWEKGYDGETVIKWIN